VVRDGRNTHPGLREASTARWALFGLLESDFLLGVVDADAIPEKSVRNRMAVDELAVTT
jgi:hypothetical protein